MYVPPSTSEPKPICSPLISRHSLPFDCKKSFKSSRSAKMIVRSIPSTVILMVSVSVAVAVAVATVECGSVPVEDV